jgi:hypothetical protein
MHNDHRGHLHEPTPTVSKDGTIQIMSFEHRGIVFVHLLLDNRMPQTIVYLAHSRGWKVQHWGSVSGESLLVSLSSGRHDGLGQGCKGQSYPVSAAHSKVTASIHALDQSHLKGFTCVLFFCGTGIWTQGLHLEPLHHPYFCEGFFKIGSRELFSQAGFKPQSSWSLPPG